jgi:uncharacterized membrane protein
MPSIPSKRLQSLDALRGLIIVFMALDHANYFIARQHSSGEHWGGGFPAYSSTLPFLTRLVTHFCPPGFFFLMGAGMLLFSESRRKQGWSTWQVSVHFWIRAGLLIALQLLVVNPIWRAGPETFPATYIGVLIALGGTMIIGSLLLRLNATALLLLTLGLLIGTEWLHPAPAQWGALDNDPWNLILMRSGGDDTLWSNYPVLPWLELVVFGMLFGRWLLAGEHEAYQKGFMLGLLSLLLFAVIRYFDDFGNIRPRAGDTWIDFLNVVKYPPSLAFTFLTMGINLLVLWGFSRAEERLATFNGLLAVYGREPLFAYLLHLFLYMLIGRLFFPSGTSLTGMFPYWLLGLSILFPLALWYGHFKQEQSPQSIWRFL